ncbi:FAD-dependent oxidoreductase [Microbacterium oleivorans]|uniref:Putative pyridine nucleotide-disulfide oxidoreductase (Putative NADH oxidase) n=1 Tax=Microbacterium oleivorans TaxID=273677 RepID=A0A031FVL4_9MICO|nr:FAD-dependent oxidoreductase [Microbacterium oleivorans]EZP27655.1 putative pyridine nucleotide-disulfide oxidoreductase (putative NADH oxidase) [Microbacterium oleivorans]
MRTIIIGGVAAGMSAATRLRRLDEQREIVVFERGSYVSFANCGLPYYVGGVIEDRSALLLQTPASLAARFALEVHVQHEVVAIDSAAKTVTVRDLASGAERVEEFDDLVLAMGATVTDGIPGEGVPVISLRSVEDVDAITEVLAGATAPRAVVAGGGFIGVEAVENLVTRGAHVTLVQRGAQVLSPLDPEMASPVHRALTDAGVDFRARTTIERVDAGRVTLSDGTEVAADLVVDARGVRPDVRIAAAAGVGLGPTGGIAVDDRHRTDVPGIWAAGDAVEKTDHLDGQATLVTMAGLANRHGRAVADDIARVATIPATPALGTSIVGVLGVTVGLVGWSERRLVAAGHAHRVVHTHPFSHATYYPGAEQMAMKLLVDPETDLLLGAQLVGRAGVDKRLDVLAVAMAAGLTASALSQLELAYAPQYGSAKDAINMAGYVAENLATGTDRTIQWHEVDAARVAGAVVVDVRTNGEHEAGAIPGSILLPLDDLRERHGELPDAPLIVHCKVGQRGHTASRILQQLGHDVRNLDGGWLTWSDGVDADLREKG